MTNDLATPFVACGEDLVYREPRPASACRSDPCGRLSSFIAYLGPSVDQAIERNNPGHRHTAPGNRYPALLLNLPQQRR